MEKYEIVMSEPIILKDVETICNDIKNLAKPLESSAVVVAGGCGFIGKYIVNTLSYLNAHYFKKPCSIISIDKSIDKKEFIAPENVAFMSQDVSKPVEFAGKIDYIVHAASIPSPIVYRKHPLDTIDVNVSGTRNMLELAKLKSVKSFLYMSSSEVYGDPTEDMIPTKEDYRGNVSFTGPRACYDESKRLAETLCAIYFQKFGLPVKIARPFNVYGPGLKPDDGRVVPDFIRDALLKKEITLFSDGKPTRSFCYVSDATRAFFRILLSKHNGEAFNVGNDSEISIYELATIISRKSGAKIKYGKHADNAYTTDNPQRRCPDMNKIKNMTGYTPEVSLEEGVENMISLYRTILKVSE